MILKTGVEQHTLIEKRTSMYLSFSCFCCHCNCDEQSKKKNIENDCSSSCGKTTEIRFSGFLNKAEGLINFSKLIEG